MNKHNKRSFNVGILASTSMHIRNVAIAAVIKLLLHFTVFRSASKHNLIFLHILCMSSPSFGIAKV